MVWYYELPSIKSRQAIIMIFENLVRQTKQKKTFVSLQGDDNHNQSSFNSRIEGLTRSQYNGTLDNQIIIIEPTIRRERID